MNALAAWMLMLGLLTAVLLAMVIAERRRLAGELVAFRLRFPRQLDQAAVEGALIGFSGLLLPWWRRWIAASYVVLEVRATAAGTEHWLLVPADWARAAENAISAAIPAVRIDRKEVSGAEVQQAAEYRLSTNSRSLYAVDPVTSAASLLGSLQPLRKGEAVMVQWVLTPSPPLAPARVVGRAEQRLAWPAGDGLVATNEEATALRQKQANPQLLAVARIGVGASTPQRRNQLLRDTESTWYESRAPGVHLRRRILLPGAAAARLIDRAVPLFNWPGRFNTAELAALIGWPIGALALAGLELSPARLLPPSPAIPSRGSVLGDSLPERRSRPLAMDTEARLRHLHVLGPTGTGKSTLLVNLAAGDLETGRGLVLLDPKGDLVEAVLERMPIKRDGDVIVLDPAEEQRPVGLNPLRVSAGTGGEVVVENLLGLFKSLYRSSWGPRTDDIFRAGLLTLSHEPGATLCELPLLLSDPSYRRRVVGRLDDPVGLESFWGWYEGLSDAERLSVVGPVLNKVRAFTMRPRVRAIVGQSEPALSMSQVMAEGKVLLVSLASGVLGEEAASLLGALLVAELWHATSARAGQRQATRAPFMAYLDEWQHFLHLPTSMATMLAEARGLGLGLVLAHQHIDQLPEGSRGAVLANARSRVIFQLAAADARIIGRELGGTMTPEELTALGPYEAVAQIYAAGATQTPASLRSRPAPWATRSSRELRERSRQAFGVPREEIEAAIRRRHLGPVASGAIGRKPTGGRGSSR